MFYLIPSFSPHLSNNDVFSEADQQKAPKYVLSLHSSKGLLAEQQRATEYILADTIIQLAMAKGTKHEVGSSNTSVFYGVQRFFLAIICPMSVLVVPQIPY